VLLAALAVSVACARRSQAPEVSIVRVQAGEQERCPPDTLVAGIVAHLVRRGCSREVSSEFAESFRQEAHRRWYPQGAMAALDPHGQRYGGQALVSQLLVEIDRSGTVAALSLERPSGVPALDDHAREAFAVGTVLWPPPDCAREDRLQLWLALCLEVERPRPPADAGATAAPTPAGPPSPAP
jgi:hypothetical protein